MASSARSRSAALSGGRLGVEQRPSPAAVARARGASRTVSGAAFGIDQRAQIIETVRGNQPGRDQFPETGFDFRLQPPRAAHNVGEKRSSTFAQKCVYLARRALRPRPWWPALSGGAAAIQSASSRTKKAIGATLVGITRRPPEVTASRVAGCGDKRAPTDRARKAKLIENLR